MKENKKPETAQEVKTKAPETAPVPPDAINTQNAGTNATVGNVAQQGADKTQSPPTDGEKKSTVTLRHKTEYPHYRRAGLVLSQKAQSYEVTAAQLAVLEKDKWIEVGK